MEKRKKIREIKIEIGTKKKGRVSDENNAVKKNQQTD